MEDPIVIVSVARTPIGSMLGQFSGVTSPELGAAAIQAVVERAPGVQEHIDEVFMGCVLTAGLGQAPARQAALGAGLAHSVPCTTINKMCGSGMQAVILAVDRLRVGSSQVIVAGGQENMSRAPYLLSNARQGYRFGHDKLLDHMLMDGLEDAYHRGRPMGYFAEMTAQEFGYTREQQDDYALRSLERATTAQKNGYFNDEIVTVKVRQKKDDVMIELDEGPSRVKKEKIPTLPAVFVEGGTVTAANASAISDGAAALLLMRLSKATTLGLNPMAKIMGHHTVAQAPEWFTTAPCFAVEGLLKKLDWTTDNVDLFEINEAFAVVALRAIDACGLAPEKVNIHGGATVLGHPIGASGARILVTLLHALKRTGGKRGIAALCIGGGEGSAVAIELL